MDIEFSNGEKRQYERLKPSGEGAVLVIPMLDDDTVIKSPGDRFTKVIVNRKSKITLKISLRARIRAFHQLLI
jgi:hypothetical protein